MCVFIPHDSTSLADIYIGIYLDTYLPIHMCVLVAQSCLTLRDPMDCSSPGSFVRGILQARILEWVAISFSNVHPWMCVYVFF